MVIWLKSALNNFRSKIEGAVEDNNLSLLPLSRAALVPSWAMARRFVQEACLHDWHFPLFKLLIQKISLRILCVLSTSQLKYRSCFPLLFFSFFLLRISQHFFQRGKQTRTLAAGTSKCNPVIWLRWRNERVNPNSKRQSSRVWLQVRRRVVPLRSDSV